MNKTIKIPESIRDKVQKAHMERDSRKDILTYILSGAANISQERLSEYQKEYDNKFFEFEKAKSEIEKEYVMPATDGKASNWSLDYSNCVVTITTVPEDNE